MSLTRGRVSFLQESLVSLEAIRRGFKTANEVINTVWLMALGEGANMS